MGDSMIRRFLAMEVFATHRSRRDDSVRWCVVLFSSCVGVRATDQRLHLTNRFGPTICRLRGTLANQLAATTVLLQHRHVLNRVRFDKRGFSFDRELQGASQLLLNTVVTEARSARSNRVRTKATRKTVYDWKLACCAGTDDFTNDQPDSQCRRFCMACS